MSLDWQTELVRVSLFSNAPIKISDVDWKEITGEQEAPTRTNIPSGRVLIGPALDGQLSLAQSGSRVDCVLSPVPGDTAPLEGYIKIGPWAKTVHDFHQATAPWIQALKFPITRIAIGSVLLWQATSHDAAYEVLGNLLKSFSVDPKMEDLLFRVNWPRESHTISGLTINRFITWTAVKLTIKTLSLAPNSETIDARFNTSVGADLVRVDIDNNSRPEWDTPFEASKALSLYKELIDLAFERGPGRLRGNR